MAGKPIHVLVVDDEVRFADNLSRLLSARGFSAEAVYDGLHALRLAAENPPDAMVLDLKMPGINGIETLQELKRRNDATEVIMLTGHADVETGIQAIREGAFDYLLKPCDIELLAEKIQEAVTAKEIKQHPVLWPRRVVKEISNADFIRLDMEDDLRRALDIFNAIGGAGKREQLHVTDSQERLRGVISKKDLIAEARRMNSNLSGDWNELSAHPQWLPEKKVGDVMHPPPEIASEPDEKLEKVAGRMMRRHLRYMPVIEDGRFLGIIRFKDILHYVSLNDADPGEAHGNAGE